MILYPPRVYGRQRQTSDLFIKIIRKIRIARCKVLDGISGDESEDGGEMEIDGGRWDGGRGGREMKRR
jgi:hypothetical protein